MRYKAEIVICILSMVFVCGTSARFESMIRKEIETIQKLAMIRQKILLSLGVNEHMPTNKAVVQTQTTTSIPPTVDRSATFKKVDSFSSEIPENMTDEHVIQFYWPRQSRENILKIENVDLLIRVQYKRKRGKRSQRSVKNDSSANTAESSDESARVIKSSSTMHPAEDRPKRRPHRRRYKLINIIISEVDSNGSPGAIISSVKSKIKRTTTLKVTLPNEKIQRLFDTENDTLKLKIQCKGCGKKAKLILVHKNKRKSKRFKSTQKKSIKLHKRRPILLVQSKVLSQ